MLTSTCHWRGAIGLVIPPSPHYTTQTPSDVIPWSQVSGGPVDETVAKHIELLQVSALQAYAGCGMLSVHTGTVEM